VVGKHSGRHAVQSRCEELGLTLTKLELDRVYRQLTALADRQKTVSDQEIAEIVETVRRQEGQSPRPGSAADARHDAHPAPIEVGYGHGV
jgi:isopropylmalate/homocitrate/citramalate synthase